jgi:hypothetical protein
MVMGYMSKTAQTTQWESVVKRIESLREEVERRQTRSVHQSREILDACEVTATAKTGQKRGEWRRWGLLRKV